MYYGDGGFSDVYSIPIPHSPRVGGKRGARGIEVLYPTNVPMRNKASSNDAEVCASRILGAQITSTVSENTSTVYRISRGAVSLVVLMHLLEKLYYPQNECLVIEVSGMLAPCKAVFPLVQKLQRYGQRSMK